MLAASAPWSHVDGETHVVVSEAALRDTTPADTVTVFTNADSGVQTVATFSDGNPLANAAEFAVPRHIRNGNRDDNRYIDNTPTHHQMSDDNSIGVEFTGNVRQ